MKKIVMSAVGAIMLIAAGSAIVCANIEKNSMSEFFDVNVEALTQEEATGAMQYICKYLGCCGGQYKCFTGEISYGGVSVSGTFYMN